MCGGVVVLWLTRSNPKLEGGVICFASSTYVIEMQTRDLKDIFVCDG